MVDYLVIGAGLSGLACARGLARSGASVQMLEKSRGVGGRCATRRLEGQPVDLGVTFLHGTSRRLIAALETLEASERVEWPRRVVGDGPPCAPGALDPDAVQIALRSGVNAFPKALAQGLDVQREQTAVSIVPASWGWTVRVASGRSFTGKTLVLALPLEQAHQLLGTIEPGEPELRGLLALMGMASSSSCLTLGALYPLDTPDPGFDVMHPSLDSPIALISHDSSKREKPSYRALVIQGRTRWSRANLDESKYSWGGSLLAAAAATLGDWVKEPLVRYEHRWRFARIDGAPAFRSPVLTTVHGATLAVTGEGFSDGGGVQGAFTSGLDLADRLLEAL